MIIHTQSKSGFTLIEVVIYIALFATLLGSVVISAYTLFESAQHNQTQNLLVEEGNFLLDKITWVVADTKVVNSPAVGTTGSILSVTKFDATLPDPFVVKISGNTITLERGSASAHTLNNSNVWITDLTFTHETQTYSTSILESISTTFTLHTHTPEGREISHVFSTTEYLEK